MGGKTVLYVVHSPQRIDGMLDEVEKILQDRDVAYQRTWRRIELTLQRAAITVEAGSTRHRGGQNMARGVDLQKIVDHHELSIWKQLLDERQRLLDHERALLGRALDWYGGAIELD